MTEFIVIFVTAGSPEEAQRLARYLVENRLAACVNRISRVQSIYRWEGKIETSDEELLIIKTHKNLFPEVERSVRENHSYSVPEIVALPLIAGSVPYLEWLGGQVSVGKT
ncbi:MAG TPA: divalent-cation tolerance protein CutA [Candidatus Binatia bacterium]